jgi:hypothetical protein
MNLVSNQQLHIVQKEKVAPKLKQFRLILLNLAS